MLPIANEARVCKRCGYETTDNAAKCPRCGGRMMRAKTVRALGWLLVGLGSFLIIFMGAITIYVAKIIFHTGDAGTGAQFTGGVQMEFFMFGLFGVVIVFGIASVAGGAWQVRYAKPNRKLTFIIIGLGILFIIVGQAVRFMR